MSGERGKVLYIASHRPGRAPNQRFRFEQYIPHLQRNGFEVDHSYLIDEKADELLYSKGKVWPKIRFVWESYRKRKRDLRHIHSYDVVIVAREALMVASTFFERGVAEDPGTSLVLDIDDAVWLPNVSGGNARFGWVKGPRKIHRSFRYADLIMAGNAFLAEYASRFNRNVRIIPTTIDTSYHRPLGMKREDDRICIGWTGSPTTVSHFEKAVPALKALRQRFGDRIRFKLIGDGSYRNDELGVEGQPWKKEREIEDLADIDIGIMPLPDTEWAKGKCGLKALQYMALEVPAVVSPVGVNSEIVRDGVDGYLADSQEEWTERLSELIEERGTRIRMGKVARERVKNVYSVEAYREEYQGILEEMALKG